MQSHEPAAGRSFSEVFTARPARMRLGLVPGRRVWTSLAVLACLAVLGGAVPPVLAALGPATDAPQPPEPAAAARSSQGSQPQGSQPPSATPTAGQAPSPVGPSVTPTAGGTPSPVGPSVAPAAGRTPSPVGPSARPAADRPSATPADTPAPAKPAAQPTAQLAAAAPRPAAVGSLYNPASKRCLSGRWGADGVQLVIENCADSRTQQWSILADRTIRTVGLCMDAAGGGTANLNPVQLAYCSGNSAQVFVYTAPLIVSRHAGKCVDVINHGTANLAPIVLWPCEGGGNQQWVYVR